MFLSIAVPSSHSHNNRLLLPSPWRNIMTTTDSSACTYYTHTIIHSGAKFSKSAVTQSKKTDLKSFLTCHHLHYKFIYTNSTVSTHQLRVCFIIIRTRPKISRIQVNFISIFSITISLKLFNFFETRQIIKVFYQSKKAVYEKEVCL